MKPYTQVQQAQGRQDGSMARMPSGLDGTDLFRSRSRSFLDGSGSQQNVPKAPVPVEMCRLRRLRLRIREISRGSIYGTILIYLNEVTMPDVSTRQTVAIINCTDACWNPESIVLYSLYVSVLRRGGSRSLYMRKCCCDFPLPGGVCEEDAASTPS